MILTGLCTLHVYSKWRHIYLRINPSIGPTLSGSSFSGDSHSITLCKSEDAESARFAIGAVANIVEDVENHGTLVQDEEFSLLINKDESHKSISKERILSSGFKFALHWSRP